VPAFTAIITPAGTVGRVIWVADPLACRVSSGHREVARL
jgi:hypothetical protein